MKRRIGIERERFIVDPFTRKILPVIGCVLPQAWERAKAKFIPVTRFGYELFAGQIEDRTPPCASVQELKMALRTNDKILKEVAEGNFLDFDFTEFAKELEPSFLLVNPFDKRHKKIWYSISEERRLAASQVAAVHVHIEVNQEEAVKVLNACDKDLINWLIKIGDHSHGKRISAYRLMSQSDGIPPLFSSGEELLNYIQKHGGERNVWDFVRYKPSTGTIEFRTFGTTEDIEEIIYYVEICLNTCRSICNISI